MILTIGLVAVLTGTLVTQTPEESRKLTAFHGVTIKVPLAVELRPGAAPAVTLQGDPAVFPLITTEVRKGNLVVGVKPKATLPPGAKVRLVIVVAKLDGLAVTDAATVTANLTEVDKLTVQADHNASVVLGMDKAGAVTVEAGNGASVRLAGAAEGVGIGAATGASVNALQLRTKAVAVNADTGAQVSAHALLSLEAQLDHGAVLRVKGTPMSRRVNSAGGAQVLDER